MVIVYHMTSTLGSYLKTLLNGRPVKSVAENVGVTAATIYAWFQDAYPPDEVNLRRFLLAVEVHPDEPTAWGLWTAAMQNRAAKREARPPIRRRAVPQQAAA